MKVLVIEAEPQSAHCFKHALIEDGHQVNLAADGPTGLRRALTQSYDVILLDRLLPSMDGLGLLHSIRANCDTPILMTTARGTIEDKVEGLRSGADDYLVKPCSLSELQARVLALGRRARQRHDCRHDSATLALGDLQMDLYQRKAQRGGRRLNLTAKEFRLLALFVRKQGQILSRLLLAEQVWDINFDSNTNIVDVAVRRLRAKLDEPFAIKLLHTVRGMGYVCEWRSPS